MATWDVFKELDTLRREIDEAFRGADYSRPFGPTAGGSWTPRTTGLPATANWQSIASSAGGTKRAAVVSGGGLYITTGGTITGGQFSSLELQYIGNNRFIVLSQDGNVSFH
jgi:hypothetical protein